MKLAVLGIGRIGHLHAELLAEIAPEVELILADADAERAASLAAELGAVAVAAHEAIAGADAVVVATPAETHRSVVEQALDAGCVAFCEKPLAGTLEETLALVERVESRGEVLQVGFQRRFDPGFAAARELVATGRLGRLALMRLCAHDPVLPPSPATDAGPLGDGEAAPLFRDSSIHDFDLARWLASQDVVEVTADAARRDEARPDDPRRIETAVVTMRLSQGTLAVLDATLLDPRGYDIRAELIGARDAVSVGFGPRMPLRPVELAEDTAAERWTTYLERFRDAYRAELEVFLAVARGEAEVPCTARDGLEAMRVAVAATRSVAEQRTVALREVPV